MMMKLPLFLTTLSLLIVAQASATIDTMETPSPAHVITQAVVAANADVESVIKNNAINASNIRLNPRAKSFVQDYTRSHGKFLLELKQTGLPYLTIMEEILEQHGLPAELKYVAVVESKLKTGAVSHVGAVGPWQFMAGTAKGYGLKIGNGRDDRRDVRKSTHAAAKYLKYLYNEFGDWLLAIAAYNGGPGYVYSAIRKSGSRNFWKLQQYLPEESRNHVKRFIGTHYIMEGQGSICTLTKDEATEQIGALAGYLLNRNLTASELERASTTTISGKYRAVVIAKYVNMDMDDFGRYNPQFDKLMDSESNAYEMKLPAAQMEKFIANKYPILNESVQLLLNETEIADNSEINKRQQTTAIN
jgi:membrane-bound lytic murein transglycosylase D